jgi:putative membrane protein
MFMVMDVLAKVDLESLGGAVLGMIVYGVVGISLMVLGFMVFDWITPKIHVQKEPAEKHNITVGIVMGAVIIGVATVVAAAMS